MQDKFTDKAKKVLEQAAFAAAVNGHSYIGSEHLLLGLIQVEDSLAYKVLQNNDVTETKVLNLIYQLIAPDNAVSVKEPAGYTPRVRKILTKSIEEAARFMLEVAKAYGRKQCSFYDADEYARLQKLYGSMKHLQTLGNE